MCAALLIGLSGTAQESPNDKLTVYTEVSSNVQYLDANGNPAGGVVEVFQEMQKRVGDKSPIQFVPWARGYNEVQTHKDVVLFSMARTPERENMFKWVGPILKLRYIFYAKKNSGIKIAKLEDAKSAGMIGTVRGDTREEMLKKAGFTNLDSVTDNTMNCRKLMAGRVNLIVGSNIGIKGTVEQAGFKLEDVEEIFTLKAAELYVAFSKPTSDDVIRKWQKALDGMKADGTFMKIMAKWSLLENT